MGIVALSKFAKPPVVAWACEVPVRKKSYDETTTKIGTCVLMYDSQHKPSAHLTMISYNLHLKC